MLSISFILWLIFAAQQSGNMLQQQGLLRTGEEIICMSQESKRSFLQKFADQQSKLTPKQRRKLIQNRFRAFLWAKLLGKQSWQSCRTRVPPDVLRHLMTKWNLMLRISPIRMPEGPVKPVWMLSGFVYDPSGYVYDDRNRWSSYHHHIKAITSHSTQPLVALMHSDGKVWIGKVGDPDNLFRLIHSPKNQDENATAIAFHPVEPLIAVAVKALIMVYKISPSLNPELHFAVSFYESGYFCPKSKFSADKLDWNPTGTFLTAISQQNLSMCYFIDPIKNQVICGFNGGTPNYAALRSFREDISPDCSCFSVDGKLEVTGYPNGTLMVRSAVHTAEKGLTLTNLKISENVLPGKIVDIVPNPHDPLVFAIEVKAGWSSSSVSIVSVDHDGSVTIIATIPDAKSPHFHEDWLLVSSGNRILFHHMNRCNIPCLVTEFHLPKNGTMRVELDAFCVKTAPNGKVMLYYAHDWKSSLSTAEIALS